MPAQPFRLKVATRADVEQARREGRAMARSQGLDTAGVEAVVLAVSELGMNLVRYARDGSITLSAIATAGGAGIQVESRDDGPGIADPARALQDGFSTGGGLGGGLPGARRLMDEFELATGPTGTRIIARKWR
jgi:serine/threonine-protein kinase RsbT